MQKLQTLQTPQPSQKLQPLKTLLLFLAITLLAAFLAACSTESSSTTPVTPDGPDIPGPVAGETAFTLNLEKLVINRAQVTAHFTNALLKADLEKKANYSGTASASINSIATGGEFITNGNTYASNVTLTLSGELETHSLALAGKIAAYSTVYSNLRSSNVVDLAGFHRIPLPSSSSNYKGILLLSLDSEEFAGRQVFFNSGVGDLADLAFSNTPYNGGTAYLLPKNQNLKAFTNKISLAVQVKKGGSLLREERKLYRVNTHELDSGNPNSDGVPVFTNYSKTGEDITITYLYKAKTGKTFDQLVFGEKFEGGGFVDPGIDIIFEETSAAPGRTFSSTVFGESFSSVSLETPQNEPRGDANFLYRNTFTLKSYKSSAPDTGKLILSAIRKSLILGYDSSVNLRFNRKR